MAKKLSPAAKAARREHFMPDGIPKKIRCYDNDGETADRYTVVFTGRYRHRYSCGEFVSLGMSENPSHPQGVGSYLTYPYQIDFPKYTHLGKKIKFEDLPEPCRNWVVEEYEDIWEIHKADRP